MERKISKYQVKLDAHSYYLLEYRSKFLVLFLEFCDIQKSTSLYCSHSPGTIGRSTSCIVLKPLEHRKSLALR